jgi:serine/threonine protein kinase
MRPLALSGGSGAPSPALAPKPDAKKKIGEYELGRVLGEGSYSKVRHGVDLRTSLAYAIKIIDKRQLAVEQMQGQLCREIAILKLLDHDNVVRMHEVMQTTKTIYIVLELVNGCELYELLPQIRGNEPEARFFFQQLIMGLRYCHHNNVAHRDLKPENILVDLKTRRLKISDFGLANMQPAPSASGGQGALMRTVCGTPNYVAPEVLKEQGYNGFRADLWSAGVILFVMITGQLPFEDKNTTNLYSKIERGEYRVPSTVSNGARDLISRMLVVDPNERYSLEDIMRHPWFAENFDYGLRDSDLGTAVEVSDSMVSGAIGSISEDPFSPASQPLSIAGSPRGAPSLDLSGGGASTRGGGGGRMSSSSASPEAFSLDPLSGSTPLLTTQEDAFTVIQRISLSQAAAHIPDQPRSKFIIASGGLTPIENFQLLALAAEDIHANTSGNRTVRQRDFEVRGFRNASNSLFQYQAVLLGTVSVVVQVIEVKMLRGQERDLEGFVRELRHAIERCRRRGP